MFHEGDLQSGIALAMQSQKAVLCFVTDEGETSAEWEAALFEESIETAIREQAVAIKMDAGSQEAAFLTPIAPIESVPALVVIRNAALQANLQAGKDSLEDVTRVIKSTFQIGAIVGDAARDHVPSEPVQSASEAPADSTSTSTASVGYLDLPSSAGQPRLPNNAYEALREYTEDLMTQGKTPQQILEAQLTVLGKLPIFKDEVRRLTSLNPGSKPELSQTARERLLLRLPAAAIKAQMKARAPASSSATTSSASTSTSTPPAYDAVYPQSQQPSTSQPPTSTSSSTTPSAVPPQPPSYDSLSAPQRAQQAECRRLQKEREQKARDERERIKAQIRADREERRRREAVQKQNDAANAAAVPFDDPTSKASNTANPTTTNSSKPQSGLVRVQVRTFSGPPLSTTFPPTATITTHIRPWLDSQPDPDHPEAPSSLTRNIPYDFKLILTPLPNRKIEAAEEELSLTELGVRGSCTFVIAPVRGYVESYGGHHMGDGGWGMVKGGYNLVSGTVGAVGSAVAGIGRGLFGFGGPAATQQQQQQAGMQSEQGGEQQRGESSGQQNVRVRTLADQRADEQRRRGDQQLYNGNALNFQPRRDGDDAEFKKD
ncbi:uncharacterized protein AB675_12158 [Cyphellophora attinorum]|uniref:UBX domain-containing protein n=1 Tax=Cyphellophora attinorum TaxID=1664694 RepID=A0A0N1NZB7_9EURO|nr:uncharacterized protein AB675_12158 [Phialophora attinorum]KPI38383.1 hypothetical protein AB675_12158 [Phialophora attinorum]